MKQTSISGRTAIEIARSIEAAVHAGRLAAGSLLPTVRELSGSLAVSPATVAAAYRLLQGRGLLAGDRRRGTRVRGHVHPHAHPLPRAATPLADGLTDLATGNPDPEFLPALDGALRSVPAEHAFYDEPPEARALVAFARAELAADGVAVDRLVITSGALDAIERVLREHLRPGDRVAVEDPCVPALLDLIAASGLVAIGIAMDADGPLPDALASALRAQARAVILTPRAQNPTGAVVSRARATDLRRVLKIHPAVVVVENDPFAPITGAPAITLTEGRAHWAIVRSTSKFLGPDLRVALLAGDETTLARVRGRQALGPRWVSRLLQQMVLALWSDPASGRLLARAAGVYAQRREALVTSLADAGVTIAAGAGFNVWIPVRHETDVVRHLADRGWAVAAGERFRLRTAPGIRVTTSALAPDDARRFAADLAAVLRHGPASLA